MRGRILPIEVYACDWIAHLIIRLCYLDLGLLCKPHPSCLQYLIRGRVLPIKVYASDSSAILLGPWITLRTSSFLPSVSHAGESFTYQVYVPDWFAHLILRLYYLDLRVFCEPLPSCLQYLMRGRVLPIKACTSDSSVTWTLEYAAVLILFALSISRGEHL